ncbi:macrophage mannose receptor 1-like isoform X1 [Ptychodera flava]|uniref:macrophage mannose receptor 1-like isoform X1 n=1 Tax=Ptychodera flava TaxID=63121 RepID=UPI003969C532
MKSTVSTVLLLITWLTIIRAHCPSGWKIFGSKCYYFGTNMLAWADAEAYCQSNNGHLAKDTADVHSFLSGEVSQLDTSGCDPIYDCNLYIGLLYTPGEGYSWSDGSAVDESFMPWQPGEPNNGDVEKSGEIEWRSSDWSDFKWNDKPFTWNPPEAWYICEQPANPCEEGWKVYGSKCYYFGTNDLSWKDAEDYCQGEDGHLAKDTEDVHAFLSSEVASLDTSGCSPIYNCNLYIGLLYTPGEGYSWTDGSAVDESFMPWQPGEPNNGEVEKSGEIELRSSDWSDFKWNDKPLTWDPPEAWYICEKDAIL